ncbi:MAG: TolC family protein [Gammaproteobacteria bacterium]
MIHDILVFAMSSLGAALVFVSRIRHFVYTHSLTRLALLLFCLLGFGVNASAATLWQAWQAARAHDPEFKSAFAALAKARAAKPGALALLLPQINGSLSRVYNNNANEGPEYFGQNQILPVTQSSNTGTTNWQIELDQPLFNWSAIKNLQAADLDAAAAAATYQHTLAQLAVKVTTAYLNVLSASASLSATRETVKGFAEQSREANARYRAGTTGVIGADSARAGLESARGELLAARQQYTAAEDALEALTGGPLPGAQSTLPTNYRVTLADTQTAWLDRALADNPRLAAARLGARADSKRIGAADAGYLPNVSLVLIHNQQIQSGSASYSTPGQVIPTPADYDATGNEIALQLNWNFFAGGATRAKVNQAQAQADQSAADAATTRLDVEREVKTRYAALLIDSQQLKTLRSAVAASRDAVQATTRGVKAGVRSEDDLVTQRERLLAAEQSLNAAIATAVQDEIALARVTGTLTDMRLHQISRNLSAAISSPSPLTGEGRGEGEKQPIPPRGATRHPPPSAKGEVHSATTHPLSEQSTEGANP